MVEKKDIRNRIKKERANLSSQTVLEYSNQIWKQLYNMESFKLSKTLFLYSSMGNEVNTIPLAKTALAKGKKIAYPKTNLDTYTMEFYYIDSLNQLELVHSGKLKILEPVGNPSKKAIPNVATLMIVPGLAFDKQFYRIGYGGGFYDKYLSHYSSVTTVGVCYDFQVVSSVLPKKHDMPVQNIITPTKHIHIN